MWIHCFHSLRLAHSFTLFVETHESLIQYSHSHSHILSISPTTLWFAVMVSLRYLRARRRVCATSPSHQAVTPEVSVMKNTIIVMFEYVESELG